MKCMACLAFKQIFTTSLINFHKALAIARFVHILALFNPRNILVMTLDKLYNKLIWNSGPDRIRTQYIIKDTTEGDNLVSSIQVNWVVDRLPDSLCNLPYYIANCRDYPLIQHCSWNSLSNIQINRSLTIIAVSMHK